MSLSPFRFCGQIVHTNSVFAITNTSNLTKMVTNFGHRSYAKDKGSGSGSCCKDIAQTAGRPVEVCPDRPPVCGDPLPPNSDPYRIKVHDMVVPPLPSTAKTGFDCKTCKPACSAKPAPEPPPCPKPPPPPFPWVAVWLVASFCAAVGLIYKAYLWKEEQDKLGDYKPIWRPRRKMKRPYHPQDLPACVQYLIIGTGAAGWAAYRAIKENDKTAKVFFITKEDCLPYRQTPMSKYMWWNLEPPDLKTLTYVEDGATKKSMYYANCKDFMDPVKFYRKKTGPAVSVASGWCVAAIDADDHVAYVKTTCGLQPIYYERCLLAPGSRPKNLSIFTNAPKPVRKKVTTLRTIRDLEIAYREVKKSKRVVVIGGGFLGSELAWHLGRMNKVVEQARDPAEDPIEPIEIVHIFKDKGILGSVLPEYLGEWGAEKIRCEGVTLMPKTQVYDAFETKDGRLQLTLSNGKSIVTDYVMVAVGNEPRDDLAEVSYLERDPVHGGYLVNTELEARTHLYIAGDAASLYSQWKDTRYRVEHYRNAEEQGFVAGANMTGYWTPCNMEPNYEFKLGEELRVQVVGEVGACMPTIAMFKDCEKDEEIQSKKPKRAGVVAAKDMPCYKQAQDYSYRYKRGMLFYLREDIVVGIVNWNIPPIDDYVAVATEILRARPTYDRVGVLAELLGFDAALCTYPVPDPAELARACIKVKKEW